MSENDQNIQKDEGSSRNDNTAPEIVSSNYEVGYRRPPVEHQFKIGQVGNPKGRPKRKKSIAEHIDDEFNRRVRVQEGGRVKHVPLDKLLIKRLALEALKGNLKAYQLLITLRERFCSSSDTTIDPAKLPAEDQTIIEAYYRAVQSGHPQSELANVPDRLDRKEEAGTGSADSSSPKNIEEGGK